MFQKQRSVTQSVHQEPLPLWVGRTEWGIYGLGAQMARNNNDPRDQPWCCMSVCLCLGAMDMRKVSTLSEQMWYWLHILCAVKNMGDTLIQQWMPSCPPVPEEKHSILRAGTKTNAPDRPTSCELREQFQLSKDRYNFGEDTNHPPSPAIDKDKCNHNYECYCQPPNGFHKWERLTSNRTLLFTIRLRTIIRCLGKEFLNTCISILCNSFFTIEADTTNLDFSKTWGVGLVE